MTKARSLLLVLASAAVIGGGLAVGQTADARPSGGVLTPASGSGVVAGGIDPRSGGFEIALGEWTLSPEAPAIRPGVVTLVIRNRGKFRHGLELELRRLDDRHGGDHEDRHRDDWDDEDVKSIRLSPGEVTRLTLNLRPGVYELECFVSHHDDLGMRGVLEVRDDAPLVKPPAVSRSTVEISGFAFKPATLRTTVGTTVTWRNADAAPHTATASQFSSPPLGKGASYRRKFTQAGTYSYLCAVHPGMRGKVIVTKGGR